MADKDFDIAPSGAAQRLVNDPMLNEILDELERAALESGVTADPSDDEKRRVSMTEVRAIRSLRRQLKTRAAGKTKSVTRVSVA